MEPTSSTPEPENLSALDAQRAATIIFNDIRDGYLRMAREHGRIEALDQALDAALAKCSPAARLIIRERRDGLERGLVELFFPTRIAETGWMLTPQQAAPTASV